MGAGMKGAWRRRSRGEEKEGYAPPGSTVMIRERCSPSSTAPPPSLDKVTLAPSMTSALPPRKMTVPAGMWTCTSPAAPASSAALSSVSVSTRMLPFVVRGRVKREGRPSGLGNVGGGELQEPACTPAAAHVVGQSSERGSVTGIGDEKDEGDNLRGIICWVAAATHASIEAWHAAGMPPAKKGGKKMLLKTRMSLHSTPHTGKSNVSDANGANGSSHEIKLCWFDMFTAWL